MLRCKYVIACGMHLRIAARRCPTATANSRSLHLELITETCNLCPNQAALHVLLC